MRTPRALPLAAAALLLASAAAGAQTVRAGRPAQPAPARNAAPAAPAAAKAELLAQFDMSARKFEALAEAMPADKFGWSPGPGVMTVARVFGHVARYNYGYPSENMGVAAPAGVGLDTLERMTDKAQLVALLRQSAEYVRQAVRQMPDEQLARPTQLYGREVPQWSVLLQLVAHMNEHLGQSIAYARMNGVVPPWSQ
jgi:uncharacterized damage-inducible protein DinB